MSQNQRKRMFQKEEGIIPVECYQEVKKRPEKKMPRNFNNQVVVLSLVI